MVIKVYGYVINEEALVQNGLDRNLGTLENKPMLILQSVIDIMCRGGVAFNARWVGVIVKGKLHRCIALANNDPFDPLPMPEQCMIDALKKVLNTDRQPRWYPYA
jgi:hypothetical protein